MESGQEQQRQEGRIKSISPYLQTFWGSWFCISVVLGAKRTIPSLLASRMQLFARKEMGAITDLAKHITVELEKKKWAPPHSIRKVQMTLFVGNQTDYIW